MSNLQMSPSISFDEHPLGFKTLGDYITPYYWMIWAFMIGMIIAEVYIEAKFRARMKVNAELKGALHNAFLHAQAEFDAKPYRVPVEKDESPKKAKGE